MTQTRSFKRADPFIIALSIRANSRARVYAVLSRIDYSWQHLVPWLYMVLIATEPPQA